MNFRIPREMKFHTAGRTCKLVQCSVRIHRSWAFPKKVKTRINAVLEQKSGSKNVCDSRRYLFIACEMITSILQIQRLVALLEGRDAQLRLLKLIQVGRMRFLALSLVTLHNRYTVFRSKQSVPGDKEGVAQIG